MMTQRVSRLLARSIPELNFPCAAGTIEVRIRVGTAHRVFVVTKFEEAIYVLHAFEKKSEKTSQADIDLAKHRYRDLIAERQKR